MTETRPSVEVDATRPRCAGTTMTRGEPRPCGNRPIKGGTVCRMHGGSIRRVKAAAARRVAVEAVEAEVARLGGRRDVHPTEVMLEQVQEAAGNVEVLRLAVMGLEPGKGMVSVPVFTVGDVVSAFDEEKRALRLGAAEGIYGPDHQGDGKPHVLVVMYGEERDRLVKFAKLCLDAGIEERRVRMVEARGRELAEVVREAIDAMNPTAAQREAGYRAAAEAMRKRGAG